MGTQTETITVYFEPLGSIAGLEYCHETIVYTNSNNVQFLATAYAGAANPPASVLSLSQAAGAANSGNSSVYGNLVTEVAPVASLSAAEAAHWMGTAAAPYQQQTVATGTDLNSQWNAISHGDNVFAMSSAILGSEGGNLDSEAMIRLKFDSASPIMQIPGLLTLITTTEL